jgi:peptide/nickel transport system substrate-binding protein
MCLRLPVRFYLVPVFIIILTGCSRTFHKEPETLALHLHTDPITLNPVLAEDAYSATIISHVYETLLERDNVTLDMKGLLATHWTISPDNLVFTFYLRQGVKFHDGRPFTAKDVVFTYQKTMDEKTPNPQKKVYYQDVLSATAPNDFTVIFVMKKPYYKSLEFLGGMEIIPEHIFGKLDNFVINDYNLKNPVGTGPYRFTSWKTREKVVLTRNENYWGHLPRIKKIEYKIIEEDSVALQALKKQDLDMNNLNSFQWVRQTNSEKFNKVFNKIKYLATSYNYIGYNTRKAPFNDKRVREAMTYLVNREKVRQTIMNNLAEITTGNFWINSKQYNHDLKPHEFNPEKAMQLLKSAGYKENHDGFLEKDGKPLTFELMVPSGAEFYRKFTPVFKEELGKYGIVVNIRQIQFQALIEKVNKRDFEAMMLGWSMDIENDPYQLWHSSQIEKGHNFTGFTTPELDYLIEKARLEFNVDIRNRYYHRIHEILHENQPYTFLFTGYNLVALQKRFQNVNVYKTGLDFREWIIVE